MIHRHSDWTDEGIPERESRAWRCVCCRAAPVLTWDAGRDVFRCPNCWLTYRLTAPSGLLTAAEEGKLADFAVRYQQKNHLDLHDRRVTGVPE